MNAIVDNVGGGGARQSREMHFLCDTDSAQNFLKLIKLITPIIAQNDIRAGGASATYDECMTYMGWQRISGTTLWEVVLTGSPRTVNEHIAADGHFPMNHILNIGHINATCRHICCHNASSLSCVKEWSRKASVSQQTCPALSNTERRDSYLYGNSKGLAHADFVKCHHAKFQSAVQIDPFGQLLLLAPKKQDV